MRTTTHLSRRKPTPIEVVNLDAFDTAFLIFTGNVKMIDPFATVARVLKANGDLDLWGPEARLMFQVFMNGWGRAGGNKLTDEVIAAFDLEAEDATVEARKVDRAFKRHKNLGRDMWNRVEKKTEAAIEMTQLSADSFYDQRLDDYMKGKPFRESFTRVMFKEGITPNVQREKIEEAAFRRWYDQARTDNIQRFVNEFPEEVLHPEVDRLVRLAQQKPAFRTIDRFALKDRVRNIGNRPAGHFDNLADVEAARAWNITAAQVMEVNQVTDYQVVSERDRRVCPVCTRIDGRVFSASRALQKIAQYQDLDPGDREGIARVFPFPRVDDLDNVPPSAIREQDLLPPFHGRCRCETVMLFTRNETSASSPTSYPTPPRSRRSIFRSQHMTGWDKHPDKNRRNAFKLLGKRKQAGENIAFANAGKNRNQVANWYKGSKNIIVDDFYAFGPGARRTLIDDIAGIAQAEGKNLVVLNPAALREAKLLERLGFQFTRNQYVADSKLVGKLARKSKIRRPPKSIPRSAEVQYPKSATPSNFDSAALRMEKELMETSRKRLLIMRRDGGILGDFNTSFLKLGDEQLAYYKNHVALMRDPAGLRLREVRAMARNELREIRKVNDRYITKAWIDKKHRLFPKSFTPTQLEAELVNAVREELPRARSIIFDRIAAGEITEAQAELELRHLLFRRTSNRVKWFRYQRNSWFSEVADDATFFAESNLLSEKYLKDKLLITPIDRDDIISMKKLGEDHTSEAWKTKMVGDRTGVYKPLKGEALAGRRSLVSYHDEGGAKLYHREGLAWEIDREVGIGLVPETRLVTIDGEVGSLQLFAKGAVDGHKWRGRPFTKNEQVRASLFDYLIGNTDRHGRNWMRGPTGEVIFIDNGLTFAGTTRPAHKFGLTEFRQTHIVEFGTSRDFADAYRSISDTQKRKWVKGLNDLDIDHYGKKYNLNRNEIEAFKNRRDNLVKSLETNKFPQLFADYHGGWGQNEVDLLR